jgi:nucleoside-diphosphate kinase
MEQTFGMIKPDAVEAGNIGEILAIIEKNGFKILELRKVLLTKTLAELFYYIHKERPFYNDLVSFMSSGHSVLMVLEKENAISDWRKLMGATNPAEASDNTIRKLYGKSIDNNAVHGSDSSKTAETEIGFFNEYYK